MQMNIQSEIVAAPRTKLLPTSSKPPMRRLEAYVEGEIQEKIISIAKHEEMHISAAIRELLGIALTYYEYRRGTLNPDAPQNSKTFHCQVCAKETSVRKRHSVAINLEEFKFCEDCFFADKHKPFMVRMINRI
jgi:hypothetical protein